jgi:hypothetical protein
MTFLLPAKRQKVRSGIARAPQREWPRHRRFVRSHACCVPNCPGGPIEFAHIRLGAHSGMSQRPHDWHGISLCAAHHRDAHQHGEETFAKAHKLDLQKLAAEFARLSPDIDMRDAMKEIGLQP